MLELNKLIISYHICWPVCDAINFEINRSFTIKLFFYMPKSQGKNVNISRMKRAVTNMKQKEFFIMCDALCDLVPNT